jgi:hypothetical protein
VNPLRLAVVVVLISVGAAACSTGGTRPAGTAPGTSGAAGATATTAASTTTADLAGVCRALAGEASDLLSDLLEVLEGVSYEQVVDPAARAPELVDLQRRGEELDDAVAGAGCDPAAVQGVALAEIAGAEPQGRIPEILLEVLSGD